ncbi:MAG TPA: DUF4175 family protein [bacterium]|nr:DUF4175 family protein [bacterium]
MFRRLLIKNRRIYLCNFVLKNILRLFVPAVLCFVLLLILDHFFYLPGFLRISAYYCFVSILAGAAVSAFVKVFLRPLSLEKTARLLEKMNPVLGDGLSTAFSFEGDKARLAGLGASVQLMEMHSGRIAGELGKVRFFRAADGISRGMIFRVLLSLLLLLVSPGMFKTSRLTNPFSTVFLDQLIDVRFSADRLLKGSNLEVEVRRKEKGIVPGILTHIEGKWRREKMREIGEDVYWHKLENLKEDVSVRFFYRDQYSQVYAVRVFDPPLIREIRLTHIYPSYTGKSPEALPYPGGDIEALEGTLVKIKAFTNQPVKEACLITSYGKKIPLRIYQNRAEGELLLDREGEYWVELLSNSGFSNEDPVRWNISVLKDAYPSVRIVSPGMDLKIDKKEKLEIVYEAEDDFGVSGIKFHFRKKDGEEAVRELTNPPQDRVFGSTSWDMERFSPGTELSYWISVRDNDSLKGYKEGKSETYVLEIVGFRERHRTLQEKEENVREEIFSLLEGQLALKEEYDKYLLARDTGSLEGLAERQEILRRESRKVHELLEDIRREMRKDPYGSIWLMNEYGGLADFFQHLNSQLYDPLSKVWKEKSWDIGEKMEGKIVESLEQASLLSDEIVKHSHLEDLINDADEALKKGQSLKEVLDGKELTPEQETDLRRLIGEIQDLFASIQDTLNNMAGELPEDFINQESVKNLDVKKAGESLSKLGEALRKGDWKSLMEEAESLLESLKRISRTVEEARKEVPSPVQGEWVEKFDLHDDELQAVIRKEEELKKKTELWEKRRWDMLDKKQKELLPLFKSRIQELRKKSGPYRETARHLEKAETELDQNQSHNFLELLKEAEKNVPQKEERLKNELRQLMAEIEKTRQDTFFSDKEKPEIAALGTEQSKIRDQLGELRNTLFMLQRKTAMLSPVLVDSMEKALQSMEGAESSLAAADTQSGLLKEEEALYWLRQGEEQLSRMKEALSGMMKSGLEKSGGFIQMRRGSGMTGMRDGPVRMPAPEDYRSDPLMKSLIQSGKQKVPEEYRDVILEYYRRLER